MKDCCRQAEGQGPWTSSKYHRFRKAGFLYVPLLCPTLTLVQHSSTLRASRDLLTCVCDAVNRGNCAAEAVNHFRTIAWEGLRGTWSLINCNSHVGNPPNCQPSTSGAGSVTRGTMDGKHGVCGGLYLIHTCTLGLSPVVQTLL